MAIRAFETAADIVRPRREFKTHSVDIQFLVIEGHSVLVYGYVYRFAVNVYGPSANASLRGVSRNGISTRYWVAVRCPVHDFLFTDRVAALNHAREHGHDTNQQGFAVTEARFFD